MHNRDIVFITSKLFVAFDTVVPVNSLGLYYTFHRLNYYQAGRPYQLHFRVAGFSVRDAVDSMSTVTLTHGAEPFLRSRQLCSYSRTSQHFMETEGSLPCS
jgi:hypothetical protein